MFTLLTFHHLNQDDLGRIMPVYFESNRRNYPLFFPACTNDVEGIRLADEAHGEYLNREFLSNPHNACYVLTVDGAWVSALRLYGLDAFYYLEALETMPKYRGRGYARQLLQQLINRLEQNGAIMICDSVEKSNAASLAVHRASGFMIEHDEAVDYLGDSGADPMSYGMLYRTTAKP